MGNRIKIGIISPSEIAFRRFMPAITKLSENFEFVGLAIASKEEWNGKYNEEIKEIELLKTRKFIDQYGGKVFFSYKELITASNVDAIYLPLPPGLHFKWASLALKNKKHVLIEKPSTTKLEDTKKLINIAKENNLALHENYMFIYHSQIEKIKELIDSKIIGDTRLIRANFGFPKRAENDFRYNKELGGGALLDCAGYPIRLMSYLLGDDIHVDASKLFFNEKDVDLYGSVQLSTSEQVAQIAYGMDNSYKCDIEIWGSIGTISTNRVFTAPDSLEVDINVKTNNDEKQIHLKKDDTFKKSIQTFLNAINDENRRNMIFKNMENQMRLIEEVRENYVK